jgi:hypothetical protein
LREQLKFLIDLFEETFSLSAAETSLRVVCRSTLERLILSRAANWKQRGKFRAIVEGDENSKFFHVRASQRLRRNTIRTLDVNGVRMASHDAKAVTLFSCYNNLLGRQGRSSGISTSPSSTPPAPRQR